MFSFVCSPSPEISMSTQQMKQITEKIWKKSAWCQFYRHMRQGGCLCLWQLPVSPKMRKLASSQPSSFQCCVFPSRCIIIRSKPIIQQQRSFRSWIDVKAPVWPQRLEFIYEVMHVAHPKEYFGLAQEFIQCIGNKITTAVHKAVEAVFLPIRWYSMKTMW